VSALGVDATVLMVAGVFVLAAVALMLVVVAPWKSVRKERPLDDDIETRLLLGEDPHQVAADADAAEARRSPTHDFSFDHDEPS
jgi:hypothetical protein